MNLTARLHALSVALEVAAKSPIPSVLTLRQASKEARLCAGEAAQREAKLAAVPEMVAALRNLLEYVDAISSPGDNVEKRAARAALALAKEEARTRTITDKERLDWLDQNGRIARFSDGRNAWTVGKHDSFIRDTVRQEIDMAMAEINRIREKIDAGIKYSGDFADTP